MIVSLIGSAGRAVDLEARFRRGRVILRDLRELHLPRSGLQMSWWDWGSLGEVVVEWWVLGMEKLR